VALQLVAVVAPDDRVRAAEALAAGADLLGGTVGDDPGVLPEVASGAGVGLDLHAGAVTGALLDRLAGFPQPIAVGHLLAPGVREERLAEAGVAVVVAPGRRCPPGALRRLLDAGVTVAAGSDHVRDHVHPLGRLDPLETAGHLVTAGLTAHEALAAVSGSARRVLGLPVLGVDEVVLIDACSPAEAIAAMPGGRVVSRDGQVVASTALEAWVAA
jgi:cytosine deaminase